MLSVHFKEFVEGTISFSLLLGFGLHGQLSELNIIWDIDSLIDIDNGRIRLFPLGYFHISQEICASLVEWDALFKDLLVKCISNNLRYIFLLHFLQVVLDFDAKRISLLLFSHPLVIFIDIYLGSVFLNFLWNG